MESEVGEQKSRKGKWERGSGGSEEKEEEKSSRREKVEKKVGG